MESGKPISGRLLSRRASSLFSWRRIWGPIITALGVLVSAIHWGWIAADVLGRLDVIWRIVEAMGGTPAMITAIVSSWWFGLALIATGVGYTVFIGEPERGVQRHHWWPYAAGVFLILWLTAIVGVTGYGWFELKMRETYDEGRAGIPRGAIGENNPSRPQTPFTAVNWGNIAPDQMRILVQELPHLPTKRVDFFTVPNDNTGYAYWRQFNDVFQRSGIAAPRGDQMPRGPQEEGLMLEVRDTNKVPDSAKKLLEAFAIANIKIRVIESPKDFLNPAIEFAIFIGPAPIQWR